MGLREERSELVSPNMGTAEKIVAELESLKPEEQAEVLDFVEFLKNRKTLREEEEFKDFSLKTAMRGMEDEPDLYSLKDVREFVQ